MLALDGEDEEVVRGRSPHAARQDSVTSTVGHGLLVRSLHVVASVFLGL